MWYLIKPSTIKTNDYTPLMVTSNALGNKQFTLFVKTPESHGVQGLYL